MKDCKPLFKLSKGQAIQTWRCQQDGARFRTVHGLMNGAAVESAWTTCKPKNVGRSNATTAEEQAWAQIQARYVKQLEQGGYVEDIQYVGRHTYFVPMLARTYKSEQSVFPGWWADGGVWIQPKLDGARMVLTVSGSKSRKGKPIASAGHIEEAMAELFDEYPDLVLDGELYNHKLRDDFPRLMSIIRKVNVTAEEIYEATRTLQFHVFDCAGSHGHLPFAERYAFMKKVVTPYMVLGAPVKIVQTIRAHGHREIDAIYQDFLEQGYEGQMIRSGPGGSGYDVGPNRSKHLLKRKDFFDKEFRILEVEEGEGNKSGMAGAIRYKLPDGQEFSSGIRGDRDYLRQLLKEKKSYKGGVGTVRFQGYSPKGIPRFPVTVQVWVRGQGRVL